MPTTSTAIRYLSIIEAAFRLQPHLERTNAVYWLTDLRRTDPVYRPRVFDSPRWVKHSGAIVYPETEIDRIIDELALFKHRSVAVALAATKASGFHR